MEVNERLLSLGPSAYDVAEDERLADALGLEFSSPTGTGRTPVPLGLECGDSLVVILNYHVEIHGLLNLLEFLQRDQAFVDSSDRPILNEHFVAGLRVAGYGL